MVRSVLADSCDIQTQAIYGGYVTVFWSLGIILGTPVPTSTPACVAGVS